MLLLLLTACADATWTVTTWGEDYIEVGIPASEFEDGCALQYDQFTIALQEAALLDGDGEVVGEVETGPQEMTEPGPRAVGEVAVPKGTFGRARFEISGEDSVHVAGSLSCGSDTVDFDWRFDTDTVYVCAPEDLTLAAGGEATTELTVHGDHLFYDDLVSPDAVVRGQHVVDADADADGEVTLEELAGVGIAPLGYGVGPYSEVTDLRGFITHLTRTVAHVDGEGHCEVDL